MQIKSIILYNDVGEIRRLDFKPDSLNVLSGKSRTGKSTLIEIIRYCFGRSECSVAGVARDVVAWYAVLYSVGNAEVLVAKAKPSLGRQSNNEVYLDIARNVTIPSLSDLKPNTTDDALIDELSKRLGIRENRTNPAPDQSTAPFAVTIRHTEFYLFQPTELLISKGALFYRQNESFVLNHIRATMDYFLGVIPDDFLDISMRLDRLLQQKRVLQRRLREVNEIKDVRVNQGISLLQEARQVGLVAENEVPLTLEPALRILRVAVNTSLPSLDTASIDNSTDDAIGDELRRLRAQMRDLEYEIRAAKLHLGSADGFVREADEQQDRLASIGLFDDDNISDICPVCGSSMHDSSTLVQSINAAMRKLSSDLESVEIELPAISTYINELENRKTELRALITQREQDLAALLNEQAASANIQSSYERLARVQGRISLYLEITPPLDNESAELEIQLGSLEAEIKSLSQQIDREAMDDRRDDAIFQISHKMTEIASHLDVEWDGPFRYDHKKVTAVAHVRERSLILSEGLWGSSSNVLAGHLMTLLAFHQYFIENRRPVPRFLVLDQPSSVYFPADSATDDVTRLDQLNRDEDRDAVGRMFRLFYDFAQAHGLQIILLEHANLSDDYFAESLVGKEVWRGDAALIPETWLNHQP